ncbi:AcrR family transcriptional regulator [Saccharothrix tamanrassetensis]|uniref:AcrR family transcriptional regulator n=1 Tax=Saccharothrix tamanrassetensis TaxID=1051531 RepID=A0A841CP89_9PSEU|nr:TetR/AcrR family transcriptional regulator [Saccharothrix tamanrassetensis]MBB5957958.1 AcrR family transcriptional regulator [Saccharothrix tamanrassetensis]
MTESKSRRRGAELERAILDAAWAELSELGYARFTVEGVAARAGTSKPVLYRRWKGRAELALAAWSRRVPVSDEVLDTGALRTDMIALFTHLSRRAGAMMTEIVAGVMADAFRHPEVAELLRERLARPFSLTETVTAVVNRAVERGELPPVELPHRAARAPLDLVRNEYITCGGGPLDEAVIAELVDDVYLPLLRGLGSACTD